MYPNNIKWKIYRFIFNLDIYIRPWKVIVLFFEIIIVVNLIKLLLLLFMN